MLYIDFKVNMVVELISGVGDVKLFVIGYIYSLFKCIVLYMIFLQIDNKGGVKYIVVGVFVVIVGGQKFSGFDVGICYSF